MKSIIITGSPGVGKTTQYRMLIEKKYIPAPSHTTRQYREGEIPDIDMCSISETQFIANFNDGNYLEPDLDFAFYKGGNAYYGTPKDYVKKINDGEKLVLMVTSIFAGEEIQKRCPKNVIWIHLTANQENREKRMLTRDGENFQPRRLELGDSIGIIKHPLANITLDTGNKIPTEVLNEILSFISGIEKEFKIPIK